MEDREKESFRVIIVGWIHQYSSLFSFSFRLLVLFLHFANQFFPTSNAHSIDHSFDVFQQINDETEQ
jgi:hypothetical protein